jgi:hypothetical protein
MRTSPNKKGAGRPEKEFSQQIFEGLCRIQCRLSEICGVMGLSEDTIERRCKAIYQRRFIDIFEDLSATGKMSLRRYQFKMAETNPTMAIWLGKQYLGQSDKSEMKIDVNELSRQFEAEVEHLIAGREANISGEAESETIN